MIATNVGSRNVRNEHFNIAILTMFVWTLFIPLEEVQSSLSSLHHLAPHKLHWSFGIDSQPNPPADVIPSTIDYHRLSSCIIPVQILNTHRHRQTDRQIYEPLTDH